MSNPLLSFVESQDGLPPFSHIKPEHVQPAVEQAIADCRAQVEKVLAGGTEPTWDSLCEPLTETDDRLSRLWSPVSHLNSVQNSEELREAYEACLPLLSNTALQLVNIKDCTKRIKRLKPVMNLLTSIPLSKNRSPMH